MAHRVVRQQNVFKDMQLDFAQRSLIVNYSVESVMADGAGDIVGTEASTQRKRVRLKVLTEDTDIPALAEAILVSCDLIPRAKLRLVIELLYELQQEDLSATRGGAAAGAGRTADRGGDDGDASAAAAAAAEAEAADDEDEDMRGASMNDVDEYLERLYEDDVAAKVAGARRILALAAQPVNLRALLEASSLMGALARILREDWKKHAELELILVLMEIFFCLSHFTQFHALLLSNRIGDSCMKIVELEHRRHAVRVLELQRLTRLADLQAKGDARGEAAFRKADAAARAREEAAAAAEAPPAADAADGDGRAGGGKSEERAGGGKSAAGEKPRKAAKASGGAGKKAATPGGGRPGTAAGAGGDGDDASAPAAVVRLKPLPEGQVDIVRERKKMRVLAAKSEALILVCVKTLMNLAEDVAVERKMCKRNIVALLTPLLERSNPPVLLLAVAFLRKLSIFEENKDAMKAQGIAPRLVALLPDDGAVADEPLAVATLRLAFNLTFDGAMCGALLDAGILPRLTHLLRTAAPLRAVCLRIMYHLSQTAPGRAAFASVPDVVPLVLRLASAVPKPALPAELLALVVNLSMHHATAGALVRTDAARLLLGRLLRTEDWGLLKAVRGLAQFTYAAQADACTEAAALEESAFAVAVRRAMHEDEGGGGGGDEDGAGVLAEDPAAFDTVAHPPTYSEVVAMPDEPVDFAYPPQAQGGSAAGSVWPSLVRDILRVARSADTTGRADVLADALGTLASFTPKDLPPDLSWQDLSEDGDFLGFLSRCLTPTAVVAEVVLEAVQVVSAMALDPASAAGLAACSVPRLLGNVLAAYDGREGCEDIFLQTVTAILRLLHHPETREAIIDETDIPGRVAVLLSHPHSQIAAEADECVHIIVEWDRGQGGRGMVWQELQARRFQQHNKEWCASVGASYAAALAYTSSAAPAAARSSGGAGVAGGPGGGGRSALAGARPGTAARSAASVLTPVAGSYSPRPGDAAGGFAPPARNHVWGAAPAAVSSSISAPLAGTHRSGSGGPAFGGGAGASSGSGAGKGAHAYADDEDDDEGGGGGKVSEEARAMMSQFMGHGGGVAAPSASHGGSGGRPLTSANSWAMPSGSARLHGGGGGSGGAEPLRQADTRVSEWETTEEEDLA